MATEIDSHFLFDSTFLDEVLSSDGNVNQIASKLTYITSHASHNRRSQNKISPKSFEFIIGKHPAIDPLTLRCFLNRVEAVEGIEIEPDETTRTIKYAVYFTLFWPFKAIIFTSAEKVSAYRSSRHIHGLKGVSVVASHEASRLIDEWFKKCRQEVETSCG